MVRTQDNSFYTVTAIGAFVLFGAIVYYFTGFTPVDILSSILDIITAVMS